MHEVHLSTGALAQFLLDDISEKVSIDYGRRRLLIYSNFPSAILSPIAILISGGGSEGMKGAEFEMRGRG